MSEGTIAIAADHAGFPLKEVLKAELEVHGLTVCDLGTDSDSSVDYPDFGRALAEVVSGGDATRGIIICGTGIGISIAANRVAGVRAALCHDATSARLAREHNDANILALGARLIGPEVALDCLRVFLTTSYAGGERHDRRVGKLG
ncbi:MAG: ribose 5-phosphate isomerase B [Alphaproteobacteria bacterium]|nr:ribose 5-phosphate isomerase B [Alphaproteobacteria bacterium]HCP00466.1 ribose 5-phosphate isomerase B [Rhodospirillaceae bacterium]